MKTARNGHNTIVLPLNQQMLTLAQELQKKLRKNQQLTREQLKKIEDEARIVDLLEHNIPEDRIALRMHKSKSTIHEINKRHFIKKVPRIVFIEIVNILKKLAELFKGYSDSATLTKLLKDLEEHATTLETMVHTLIEPLDENKQHQLSEL